jgi:flagellar biosynthesis protein
MPTPESEAGRRKAEGGGGGSRASALRYEGKGAPKVTASGRGLVADRIVEVARENGIPVREDPALAEALAALELDTEIPEDLYTAVAEAIAWSYSLDLKAAGR